MARRRTKLSDVNTDIGQIVLAQINTQLGKWKKDEPGIGGARVVVIVHTAPLSNSDSNVDRAIEELQTTGAAVGFQSSVAWGVQGWEEI